MRTSNLATLLALSSVAILPACSMFGGSDRNARSATASRTYAAAPNYNSSAQSANAQLSPDMIRQMQQNLSQAGDYKGRADGVWGPQTEAAVRDYQQQHNLNATGQLDQPTLSAMNLGTNNNQSYNQNNDTSGQPANQRYGSNYNPPPNTNTQPNYNPPPNNPNNPTNNDTGTPR